MIASFALFCVLWCCCGLQVTRIDPLGEPMAGDTMLGPVTVLRKDSVAEIAAFAEESLPAQRQLGEFLAKRVAAEGLPPVYGLNLGECFR